MKVYEQAADDEITTSASKREWTQSRVHAFSRTLPEPARLDPVHRCASAMMRCFQSALERAALGSGTVLVQGESGTGKELAARAIHDASPRAAGPFVKIDCASLSEQLSRLESANTGTLFLDDIGELSPSLQAKVLQLLQDREFERHGSTRTLDVNVRVVAATHRDLQSLVERNRYRADLFYRLNVVPLWLPPLRSRRDDIDGLVRHFCRQLGAANDRPGVGIDGAAVMMLRQHSWPGNVRQLRNVIERVIVMGTGSRITANDIRQALG